MALVETSIDELDIIFISYDEPNKDKYWVELKDQYPLAKRVDGVTGFDAAHKEAARIAETDRFITVDGDTTINGDFFNLIMRYDDHIYPNHVFAWASKNDVNGLIYGNGSLKCWTRESVLNMSTHEDTNDEVAGIEFCWSMPYLSMHDHYSVTHPASTPYHAFRAGFREGIKLPLHEGTPVDADEVYDTVWVGNLHTLTTWMSVGADHPNGLWAIYGARLGFYMLNCDHSILPNVTDYVWFQQLWTDTIRIHDSNSVGTTLCNISGTRWSPTALMKECELLGDKLFSQTGHHVPVFNVPQSELVKDMMEYKVPKSPKILFSS